MKTWRRDLLVRWQGDAIGTHRTSRLLRFATIDALCVEALLTAKTKKVRLREKKFLFGKSIKVTLFCIVKQWI